MGCEKGRLVLIDTVADCMTRELHNGQHAVHSVTVVLPSMHSERGNKADVTLDIVPSETSSSVDLRLAFGNVNNQNVLFVSGKRRPRDFSGLDLC